MKVVLRRGVSEPDVMGIFLVCSRVVRAVLLGVCPRILSELLVDIMWRYGRISPDVLLSRERTQVMRSGTMLRRLLTE